MDLPLTSLRGLDLTEGDAQYCGRYLADLGAQVILVEPPGGSAGRRDPAGFGLRNANKSSVLLDLADPAGQAELLRLAGTADIPHRPDGGRARRLGRAGRLRVFGAELGRLLADQGADVIKVENSAFPDGLRQTLAGGAMNASFAWAQRNKRGLGLDLRSEPGRRLFLDLGRWTAVRRPDEVMAAVGAAGVPAGSMRRLPELLTDPHLAARESFRTMAHPLLSRPVPAKARAARFSTIGDPPLRPAPVPGQHTRQVAETLLGLAPADIDHLVDKGVLQEGEA